MKTLYISEVVCENVLPEKGTTYFCIGVKDDGDCDLGVLEDMGWDVTRLKEVKNARYLGEDGHILQPAFVTRN